MTMTVDQWLVPATVSALIAMIALIYNAQLTWKSLDNQTKALQAQTVSAILNAARTIHFSRGMDAIRALPSTLHIADLHASPAANFDAFLQLAQKDDIRDAIDFLNDLRHLALHAYVTKEHILSMYEASIEACVFTLHPWWVQELRRRYGPPGS